MVFSSTTFLLAFLPLVAILYYICPRKLRNGLLLVFSLLFYGWGEPKYILIMLFSTVFDYCNGLAIGHLRSKGREGGAKAVLVISVVGNLAILGFFKYTDFAISNLNGLLGTAIPALGLLLPIGISFYTFQTMSYTIDVYRGLVPPQRNIVDFGAYVTLFPQLIAGPIVQYKTVAYDLEHRRESVSEASEGLQRLVIGLGKKVLIANYCGSVADKLLGGELAQATTVGVWIGVIMYTLTSPATRTWPSAWGISSGSISWRTSTIPMSHVPSLSSGGGGTSACPPGSGSTSTSPWAATARARVGSS